MADFNYILFVTGDCQNNSSGSIEAGFSGGTPPYTVTWYYPSNAGSSEGIMAIDYLAYDYDYIDPFAPKLTFSQVNNLSAATYPFRVNDSTVPVNLEFTVNVPVSSGNCATIVDVSSTTCSQNNGTVSAEDSSDYSETSFFLYTFEGELLQSATTDLEVITFQYLSAGTYYIEAVDYGGCTGKTQTFVVNPSVEVDFGFYIIPDTQCGQPSGKLIVTGQTGVQPWSYIWNNGSTGSTISGLTAGTYSVKVTDSSGCYKIREQSIGQVDPVGLGSFVVDNIPTCLNTDGVITMTITGGTGPYYYSASTGQIDVSYSQSFSLSGVPAGSYNFLVTDAALCKFSAGIDLATENGISDIILTVEQSSCSNADGSILITAIGGTSPFTFTLVYPDSSTETITTNAASQTFDDLSGGTYTIILEDSSGCYFLEESTILSDNIFTFTATTTGTTCGGNTGIILVEKSSGGTSPFDYSLDGVQNIIDTTASAVTFTNVSSGQHQITITDTDGCEQVQQVFVNGSLPLIYNLYSTSCGQGSDGLITTFISEGVPPFEFEWSDNVSGNPQSITATGLTAGTYSVTVIDSGGCSQTRNAVIDCDKSYVSYRTYLVGEQTFSYVSGTKKGLGQIMNTGFDELTTGRTNCQLVSATFIAKVELQPDGIELDQDFYVSTSLVDAPPDSLWYNTVQSLLETVPGIGQVTVNELTSEITIETDRSEGPINCEEVVVELIILYDIRCLS